MAVSVPLTSEERDALRRLAEIERRRPQDQAAVLLSSALRALGLLGCEDRLETVETGAGDGHR